ncbi:hypothetical protein CBL_09027 [Carabus blaptoides fortunei]
MTVCLCRKCYRKEQVNTEEQAKCSWDRKWHFMRDFYKTYLKEAAVQGLSEEEFLKLRTTKIRPKDMEVDGWVAQTSLRKFPITSSAMVGWRSSRIECSMERFGPLYISPRHTVTEPDRPSSPAQQHILLG